MLKTGLWDNDGVLYEYTSPLKDTFKQAAYGAVRLVVDPDLTDEDAADLLKVSRQEFGDSFAGLVAKGYSEAELNIRHHAALNHTLIKPDLSVIAAFKQSVEAGITHGIFTHGVSEWCDRTMVQSGLGPYIPKENRVVAETFNFAKKHSGSNVFVMGLDYLGFDADETFFVEDSVKNLKPAREAGLYTVLIHRGAPLDPLPDYVDFQCKDVPAVFRHIEELNASMSQTTEKPHPYGGGACSPC